MTAPSLPENFARPSGRTPSDLRQIRITRGFTRHAEGSVLIEFGDTRVLCTASVEESVPPFLRGKGQGWVTAEYGMLPRTQEIQRLIGRSLRAVVDMNALGERQITIDCDVLQADGGTRTAAITGACVAVHEALQGLVSAGRLAANPMRDFVAAVSVGVYKGVPVLDLDYPDGSGGFVEVQGTAEGSPFSRTELDALLELAGDGIARLVSEQKKALGIA